MKHLLVYGPLFALLTIVVGQDAPSPAARPYPEPSAETIAASRKHFRDMQASELAVAANDVRALVELLRHPNADVRATAISAGPRLGQRERLIFALAVANDPVFLLPRPHTSESGGVAIVVDERIRTLLEKVLGGNFGRGSFYDEAFRETIRARLVALQARAGANGAPVLGAKQPTDAASKKGNIPAQGEPLAEPPPPTESNWPSRSTWLIGVALVVGTLVAYWVKKRRTQN